MTFKATTDAYLNHLTNKLELWKTLALAANAIPLIIQGGMKQ